MEGADHQTVVQFIRNSGSQVHLVVVSVTADESRKLEPENTGMSAMDYFERRSVPVSVPDTERMKDDAGKEFVVYNIYLANKHATSRRYREFDALNNNVSLINEFELIVTVIHVSSCMYSRIPRLCPSPFTMTALAKTVRGAY